MKIENTQVYGLENAIKVSKYPMVVDTKNATEEVTNTVLKLGNSKKGSGHSNFLKGIIVQFDLTFTNKAWTELQRYNFIDFISSQSTMHRISKFNLEEQYCEYVDERIIEIMKELQEKYNQTKDKDDYLRLLYSNPCGFQLTAGMTTNYLQLKTMYEQRRQHKLPDWQMFCDWVEELPMFKELCLRGKGELNDCYNR